MFNWTAAFVVLSSHLILVAVLNFLVKFDQIKPLPFFKKDSVTRTFVNQATLRLPLILGCLIDIGSTVLLFVVWLTITIATLPINKSAS